MSVAGSCPGPSRSCRVCSTKAAVNSSTTEAWTRNLLAEMHTWPALRNLPSAAARAAASMSASGKTSTGAWPPSSIDTDFRVLAASVLTAIPTGTEPVRLTLRMIGEVTSCSLSAGGSPVITLSTPAGTPAACAASANSRQLSGDSIGGTATTEHPVASAGAILRAGSSDGKFQGAKAATGPTGSRRTVIRMSVLCPSTVRP